MSKIIVAVSTSYLAEDTVMSLLKGGFVAKVARISYNVHRGLPMMEEPNKYPLILEGTLGNSPLQVHVTSVTAGYGGTGPLTMVDLLNAAGFMFDKNDILTPKYADYSGQIDLTYYR